VAFPQRNLILFITFVVILFTLVVQGLTLPWLINRSKVFMMAVEETEEETIRKIRHGLKQHIYQFLKDNYEHKLPDHIGVQKMMQHWEERAKAEKDDWMDDKIKVIYLETLESQRQYLTNLNNDPLINEELIRRQLFQIDLEEVRLRMI
jgi:CPA1 family monovalent cation:H+ antiporter